MAVATLNDLLIGRLLLPSIEDPITEQLGSDVQSVGETSAVGQRKAKGFTLNFVVHGFNNSTIPSLIGNRMRRQLRSLVSNAPLRLQGLYMNFAPDIERNCWLVIGEAELADDDGGITFGNYKLSISQALVVGQRQTHRDGYRVTLTDRRSSTAPLDVLGQIINTSSWFAAQTPLALTFLPVGATDLAVLEGRVASGQRSGIDGNCPVCQGRVDGDVITWERAEADQNKGDVIVYDRRGQLGPFYRPTIVTDTPVAYLRVDETAGTAAADTTGNGHAGTYIGGATLNQTGALTGAGDTDASVLLNGTTGEIKIPYATALATSAFSVEMWVKPTALASGQILVASLVGNKGYQAFVSSASGAVSFWVFTGSGHTAVSTGNVLANGVWTKLLFSYDGTTARVKVNGVTSASGASTYVPNDGTGTGANIEIGASAGGGFFAGNVDELAFYNTALSDTQDAGHYAAGTAPFGSGLDPQTYQGWEEVYGPDYPWSWLAAGQTPDVPVLQNSHCRVRYDSSQTDGFRVDVWNGNAWAEQGKVVIRRRDGSAGGAGTNPLDTLVSAVISQDPNGGYTTDRAVLEVTMTASADALSRERVYITLQRGWTAPRFEVYCSPGTDGTTSAVGADINFTTAIADTNDSIACIDTSSAGQIVATAGSGSALFAGGGTGVGASTFTGENWLYMLREGQAYAIELAALQATAAKTALSSSLAYGTPLNTMQISIGATGYLSAQLGFHATVLDQVMEAESITLGTGTTSVADATASGGNAAQASRSADAVHVSRATWPNSSAAKYRVFARVRPVATTTDTINIYAKTTATTGATKTATGSAYVWVDLGDIVANGSTLEIHAWNATAARTFNVDRVVAIKVEDRTRTSCPFDGVRDHGQAHLYSSRIRTRRMARA